MSMKGIVGSLIGALGGSALGGAVGGNAGSIVGSLAGSLLGGKGASMLGGGGGGLGALGGLLGGGGGGGLSEGLGGLLGGLGGDGPAPEAEIEEDEARILVEAMCNAAKSDGRVDEAEMSNIVERLGDIDADDEAFLRQQLSTPLDLDGFVRSVPASQAADVYTVSVLAIDVDSAAEIQYLRQLADGLGISDDDRQAINEAAGI